MTVSLKDESYQRGRKHVREDEDYNHHGRDMDDAGQRRGTVKDDEDEDGYNQRKMDRYRGRASDEEDNDRDRNRQRRERDDEEYKHGRDRCIGEKEDRFRGDVAAGKRHAMDKERK
ncbi:LOW QUALITY PROTEIN: hypothetical protein YC2023_010310 [Brassica napus]